MKFLLSVLLLVTPSLAFAECTTYTYTDLVTGRMVICKQCCDDNNKCTLRCF